MKRLDAARELRDASLDLESAVATADIPAIERALARRAEALRHLERLAPLAAQEPPAVRGSCTALIEESARINERAIAAGEAVLRQIGGELGSLPPAARRRGAATSGGTGVDVRA